MADPARYTIDATLHWTENEDPRAYCVIERFNSGEWIKWKDFVDYKAAQRRNKNAEIITQMGIEIAELRGRLAELEQFAVLLDKTPPSRQ